jgi:hypothetical protein
MLQDERHTTAMLRFAGLKPRERRSYLQGGVGAGATGGGGRAAWGAGLCWS